MSEINITNEDCMKLLARYPDKYFDIAIVDPPYGEITGQENINRSCFSITVRGQRQF
ncbi:MAG: hypothetical protein LBD20_02505 [Spirochaetaceae bacterium]|jgi:DNA modification methylase|nr:hypothetical protein [Spirochaetaceae bacterium]